MSLVVPRNLADKINYFTAVGPVWAERAEQIGTTAARVAALDELTAATRAARAEQFAAQQAALTATVKLNAAAAAMARAGADIIRQVRAKAATDGNVIYELAWVPAPARPSKIGPPGTPDSFAVELRPDGSLLLSWQCKNPRQSRGTTYQVARRFGGPGALAEYVVLGTVGVKRFVDRTLTTAGAGAAAGGTAVYVAYQVTAVRSTATGTPAVYTVSFGGAAGGAAFQPTRRAA
jgi:hypothetical protein